MAQQRSMVAATAVLATVLMIGAAATGSAQTPMPSHDETPQHQAGKKDMKGLKNMSDMMGGAHHVLAMAYRDNLATFARALQGQVKRSRTVDLDIARPAAAEMTRSLDQMKQHHAAQMNAMGEQKPPMADMRQHETRLASLSEHLTALQSEVSLSTPDSKKVSEHTTEILRHCARISVMSGKGMSHSMK